MTNTKPAYISIRASQLPILDHCKGMIATKKYVPVNYTRGFTTEGTAVDAFSQLAVKSGVRSELVVIEELEKKYGVKNIEYPCRSFDLIWNKRILSKDGDVVSEYPALGTIITNPEIQSTWLEWIHPYILQLSGHPDIWGLNAKGDTLIIVDVKAGYKDKSDYYEPQLLGYGYLGFRKLQKSTQERIKKIKLVVLWLRESMAEQFQAWTYTPDQVSGYFQNIYNEIEKVRNVSEREDIPLSGGDHCTYCPRFYDCPVQQQIIRSASELIMGENTREYLETAIQKHPITVYRQLQMAEKLCRELRVVYGQIVTAHGELEQDGETISYGKPNEKIIDVDKCSIYLEDNHGIMIEEFLKSCSCSKTKLGNVISESAEQGQKGKFKMQVFEELRDAGIIKPEGNGSMKIQKKELTHE